MNRKLCFCIKRIIRRGFYFEKQGSGFKQVQKISFVPENFLGGFGGVAIRLHPNGQLLHISNRGSDSLGIFNIDLSGNWLIAANQDSDALVIFEIDQETQKLGKFSFVSVGSPVCVAWYNCMGHM